MSYKQAGGVLSDPVKTKARANSKIATEDRPKSNGRVYSKENKATVSTTGAITDNMRGQRFMNNNKIYVAGASGAPNTGRLIHSKK